MGPKGKEENNFDQFGRNGKVAKVAQFQRKLLNIAVVPRRDPGAGMVHGE